MIKKCLDCQKTFGREMEQGKCPFCKSVNIKPHDKKVNRPY